MTGDIEHLTEKQLDTLLTSVALEEIRPAATARIEAVCLARLQRRNPPADWQVIFWGVFEAAVTSLLCGSYLLWNLAQALSLYGASLR
jgi:hypothetical protein